MLPTAIKEAPALDSFTSLADHQSQTPSTFYNAKPVLHYHAVGARAHAARDHASKLRVFNQSEQAESGATEAVQQEGRPEGGMITAVVDAFITSEYVLLALPSCITPTPFVPSYLIKLCCRNLTLFNQSTSAGISIPYPAISLHAISRLNDPANTSQEIQGLYMQLELSDPYGVTDDEEPDIVELTLIPALPTAEIATAQGVQALFEAVSNCSNLHPDPGMDEDEEMDDGNDSRIMFEGNVGYEGIGGLPGVQIGATDGGLPPPFPGSGGWITAENVSEYFDADGNWIGENGEGESLGEGAGRVRTRDEIDGEGVNGHGGEEDEDTKRPRTD
jgi:chloride channel, nucleotide-sensitive, 1A